MKKILYFLSLLFIVSLSSCNKDDNNSSKDAIPMDDKQEIASNILSNSMDYSNGYSLKKSADSSLMIIQNPEGGSVEIKISMSINEQSMTMVITENFKDYAITTSSGRKYTLSTPDNPIVVNMNYNNVSTQSLTMTLKGTIQVTGFATGSITYDLTYTFNQSGSEATMTGTINGERVNITVNVNDYN